MAWNSPTETVLDNRNWIMLVVAADIGSMAVSPAAAAPKPEEREPVRLVDAFAAAQQSFDQRALSALITSDYVEISPVGEVDPREKMLGFYAPHNKRAGPAMTVSERVVRQYGNMAVVMSKLAYVLPGPDGKARNAEMRASFVARRDGRVWKLVSAQYTPIRSAKPS